MTDEQMMDVGMVVGTPRGGGQDRAARSLAEAIESTGAARLEVTNQPGRGGGVAWSRVAACVGRPDLISIGSPTMVTNSLSNPEEPGVERFSHLAVLCTEEIAFVSASSGPATAGELLEVLATEPGSVVIAIATALGNVNHLAVAAVARATGCEPRRLRVEAYDAAPAAVNAVVAGRASLAAVSLASARDALEDGSARVLASSSQAGPSRAEGVPTWAELGIDCSLVTWRSVVAPAGLGEGAIERWDRVLGEAVTHPAWSSALERFSWTDAYLPAAEAAAFMIAEDRRLRRLASDLVDPVG